MDKNLTPDRSSYEFVTIVDQLKKVILDSTNVSKILGFKKGFFHYSFYKGLIHFLDAKRTFTYLDAFFEASINNPIIREATCHIEFHIMTNSGDFLLVECVLLITQTTIDDHPWLVHYTHIDRGDYNNNYIHRKVRLYDKAGIRLETEEQNLRYKVAATLQPDLDFTETEFAILRYLSKFLSKPEIIKKLPKERSSSNSNEYMTGSTYNTNIRNINKKIKQLDKKGNRKFYPTLDCAQKLANYMRDEGYF